MQNNKIYSLPSKEQIELNVDQPISRYINYLQLVDSSMNEGEYRQYMTDFVKNTARTSWFSLYCLGLGNKAAKAFNEFLLSKYEDQTLFTKPRAAYDIQGLNLNHNNITDVGCQYLHTGLSFCENIKYFLMRENPIGDAGFKLIANALLKHSKLIELNLIGCDLTDDCMSDLNNLLAANKSLETIRLSNNAISDKGIKEILGAIKKHPVLKEVNLYGTDVHSITDNNIKYILSNKQIVESNMTLQRNSVEEPKVAFTA